LRIRTLATVLLVLLLAMLLVWCEENFGIVEGLFDGGAWPPEPPEPAVVDLYDADTSWVWLAIVPAATGLLLCGCLLAGLIGLGCTRSEQAEFHLPLRRIAWTIPVVLFLGLVLLFPVVIWWKLMHPSPIPHVTLPEPNGYNDIVAAGEMVLESSLLNMAVGPTSTAQLAAELAKYSVAYELCRRGLSRSSWHPNYFRRDVPVMDSFQITLGEIQAFRAAARALSRECQFARQEGRFADAARSACDAIHVGEVAGRGGLIVDYLVGIAVQGFGHHDLHRVTGQLDAEQCRLCIAELQQTEPDGESLEDVFYRERVWSENAYGWYGHLGLILADLADSDLFGVSESIREAISPRHQAITRLLTVELALQAFQQERGAYPEHLDELVPRVLPQVPRDPFAAAGQPLTYRRTDNGYLLYSWGYDRDDDGGTPPSAAAGSVDWMSDGDFRLDVYFSL
ncbi:MAG: hypothetical protein ACC628_27860, partial [Pirellulaceae bacterium]